jgi:hypothetical protein
MESREGAEESGSKAAALQIRNIMRDLLSQEFGGCDLVY